MSRTARSAFSSSPVTPSTTQARPVNRPDNSRSPDAMSRSAPRAYRSLPVNPSVSQEKPTARLPSPISAASMSHSASIASNPFAGQDVGGYPRHPGHRLAHAIVPLPDGQEQPSCLLFDRPGGLSKPRYELVQRYRDGLAGSRRRCWRRARRRRRGRLRRRCGGRAWHGCWSRRRGGHDRRGGWGGHRGRRQWRHGSRTGLRRRPRRVGRHRRGVLWNSLLTAGEQEGRYACE